MILKVEKSWKTVAFYSVMAQLSQLNTWKVVANRTGKKMFLFCEACQSLTLFIFCPGFFHDGRVWSNSLLCLVCLISFGVLIRGLPHLGSMLQPLTCLLSLSLCIFNYFHWLSYFFLLSISNFVSCFLLNTAKMKLRGHLKLISYVAVEY